MGTIACIGVGTVGSAWAVVFAKAGHQVRLFDAAPDQAEKSIHLISETLDFLAAQNELHEPAAEILKRVAVAQTLDKAVAGANYVQESVREQASLKRSVFAAIDAAAPAEAILASSTSAIMGSEFMGHIDRPERALVAHPVNPPSLIPLVELCATHWTSDETVTRTRELLVEAGMRPIDVRKEIDGFILNRLQYTLVAEAMHLVGEGVCSATDIDRVMTDGLALRWASLGPFAVAHLNARDGFQGFVDQLGPMMRDMGQKACTDYAWPDSLAASIHNELAERLPVEDIDAWQRWRDERILKTRKLQDG